MPTTESNAWAHASSSFRKPVTPAKIAPANESIVNANVDFARGCLFFLSLSNGFNYFCLVFINKYFKNLDFNYKIIISKNK